MPYIKCAICGKGGIQSLEIDICTTCIKRNDDRITILAIKKYLELYPDASMHEISENLGIKMDTIDRLIDEGSIQVIYDDNGIRKIANERKENPREEKRKKFIQEMSEYRSAQKIDKKVPTIEKSKLVKDLNRIYGNNHDER